MQRQPVEGVIGILDRLPAARDLRRDVVEIVVGELLERRIGEGGFLETVEAVIGVAGLVALGVLDRKNSMGCPNFGVRSSG
jgi:hypothetical protein